MPALQCSAVKCMYNKDNLCSKGDIQVKGDHAATENETWCSSFVEKTGMSNAYTCGGGCSSIQVGCAAHETGGMPGGSCAHRWKPGLYL
mgnify:CR=1 FL=1